jgi:hypothetical protein
MGRLSPRREAGGRTLGQNSADRQAVRRRASRKLISTSRLLKAEEYEQRGLAIAIARLWQREEARSRLHVRFGGRRLHDPGTPIISLGPWWDRRVGSTTGCKDKCTEDDDGNASNHGKPTGPDC